MLAQNPKAASFEVYADSLPAPWAEADIGAVALAGTAAYDPSSGSFAITGSGSDIIGTSDAVPFCLSDAHRRWQHRGQAR